MAPEDYRTVEISDGETFRRAFREDPPRTSELTFTNLFMWRHKYRPLWCVAEGCLLIVLNPESERPFGLPPAGGGDKKKALARLMGDLGRMSPEPRICRVDEVFARAYVDNDQFEMVPDRDNADYVYLAEDLIHLSGRKYHRKKNHLNRFIKQVTFEYRPLDRGLASGFFEMQESWCRMRECVESPDLLSEDYAVREALSHFEELGFQGGAVLVDGKIEAFSLGEPLNEDTAVIHIEKANPEIPGLYAAVNHLFCEKAWSDMTYINREQDLGIEGLRKAKESYYPHHLVNKITLIPR